MDRAASPATASHNRQLAAPDPPFIQGFNVHPRDFALIAEAAALHKVSLQDFVQLALYSYARDWMQAYAGAAPDDGPPEREVPLPR